jgi:hypothetical protein
MVSIATNVFINLTNLANSTATWAPDIHGNTTANYLGNGNTTADFLGNGTQPGNGGQSGGSPFVLFWPYLEFRVAWYINRYSLYVTTALAVFGNVSILATLTRMRPVTSSGCFMVGLAACDLIAVCIKLTYLDLTGNNIRIYNIGCQLVLFLGNALEQLANWICVAMATERFIAIWFPLKVSTLCTKKNAGWTMLGLTVFFFAFNFHYVLTNTEQESALMTWDCLPLPEHLNFMKTVWPWINWATYSFLPCTLLFILNGLIIVGVKRAGKRNQALTNATSTSQLKYQQQERQITIMMVTVSVTLIVLTMPNAAFFIAEPYWNYYSSIQETVHYIFTYTIVYLLADFNHAVNFYLYFLSGRKFRNAFTRLLCHCCRGLRVGKKKGQTSEATNLSTLVSSTNNTSGVMSDGTSGAVDSPAYA